MSEFTADFQRILDEELGNYSAKVQEQLAASVQAKGLVLTEELLKSLATDVVQASSSLIAQMRVEFNQYGRIAEMKGRTWDKGPPVEEIEKFVRKRGLGAFEFVPGYKRGQLPVGITQQKAITRIAWGISKARKRDGVGPKPRPWFAKTFYRSINSFIDAVTTRYAGATGTHIAASIQF
jgi:hypothetical protein